MELYKKAEQSMFGEIINIMSSCFNESTYVLKFFFEKRFNINNCYVCIDDGKLVSVLHAIPHKLRFGKETINGVYIYGACTLKQYRGLGHMTGLLKYVHEISRNKGYECSFLVPESSSLEPFYEKLGYKNLFKLRRLKLTKKEIIDICGKNILNPISEGNSTLNFYDIEKLREIIYINQDRVIYNENDIEFAHSLYQSFSFGGIVRTDQGYALCSTFDIGTIKIRDFTCHDTGTIELLSNIYNRFPNNNEYIIETSLSNSFFKDFGQPCFYGMVCPLSELCDVMVNNIIYTKNTDEYPYLGISLE